MREPIKPTVKTEAIERLIESVMGKDRRTVIAKGECMTCDVTGLSYNSFRDEIDRDEYAISAMCQNCQDQVFGEDPFDISQDI